jgi:hypothetical protein
MEMIYHVALQRQDHIYRFEVDVATDRFWDITRSFHVSTLQPSLDCCFAVVINSTEYSNNFYKFFFLLSNGMKSNTTVG